MARKRYSDEDVLKLLREIDVHLHDGLDVVSACRKAGISDKSYYYWQPSRSSDIPAIRNAKVSLNGVLMWNRPCVAP